MHYCSGEMVSVTFSSELQPCCKEEVVNCCNIVMHRFQIVENYLKAQTEYHVENITQTLPFAKNNLSVDCYSPIKTINLLSILYNSPPPLGIKDILSRLQSYLL